MSASSNKTDKTSEKSEQDHKREYAPDTKKLLITITLYRDRQIKYLCRFGIAKNPTDFIRQAILDKIRQNKDALDVHLAPQKWKKEVKGLRDFKTPKKRD